MHPIFGKIPNRIIAWDYTDSFLRKKQKIQKRIFQSRQLIACSIVKTAYHMDFFSNPFPKKHKSRES